MESLTLETAVNKFLADLAVTEREDLKMHLGYLGTKGRVLGAIYEQVSDTSWTPKPQSPHR